jgi:hypothetical protein
MRMPSGRIILKSPLAAGVKAVAVNGKKSQGFNAREVIVNEFPAKVVLSFEMR